MTNSISILLQACFSLKYIALLGESMQVVPAELSITILKTLLGHTPTTRSKGHRVSQVDNAGGKII